MWQSIETAPKDGTEVLTLSSRGMRVASYQPFPWSKDLNWFISLDAVPMGGGTYCRPTHWMPLPALPQDIRKD